MKHTVIRKATPADSRIIATAVAMSLGADAAIDYCGIDYLFVLEQLALMERSQYSYRNAIIAETGGRPVGAAIGYDGNTLRRLREATFDRIRQLTGQVPDIGEETEGGEFYIDSIGVLPECRGTGIGRKLLTAMCETAFHNGHHRIGLMVECDNTGAEHLYRSLGFKTVDKKLFMGNEMWHLQTFNPQTSMPAVSPSE